MRQGRNLADFDHVKRGLRVEAEEEPSNIKSRSEDAQRIFAALNTDAASKACSPASVSALAMAVSALVCISGKLPNVLVSVFSNDCLGRFSILTVRDHADWLPQHVLQSLQACSRGTNVNAYQAGIPLLIFRLV